jgi:uncharacterized membrane protein (UPF0127 family)
MRVAPPLLLSLASLASLADAAAGCERTPPEEFPGRPPATVGSPVATAKAGSPAPPVATAAPSQAALEGRCIAPTPPDPPPAVRLGPAPGCPPDPDGPGGPVLVARVMFPELRGVSVEAEIVRSEHDTARGLMYRTSLPEDRAMLFDLRERADHKFWMHNTCIPLDLLYIDEDGLIVGIVENAPTLNDDSRGVDCPSRYVLEVNAGWGRRHGVKAGQHLSLPAEVKPK